MAQEFIALGHDGDAYGGLETFPNPGVAVVELESDELTAMCPITNQPDNYVATIRYRPDALCLESKSVKIYLSRYRNEGAFCLSVTCTLSCGSSSASATSSRICTASASQNAPCVRNRLM